MIRLLLPLILIPVLLTSPPLLMATPRRNPSRAEDHGSLKCCHPFCPATPSSSNTLLITCADGPEGLALATAILSSEPLRSQLAGVVAAVSSEASEGAEKLRRLRAEVRPMAPLGPGVFQGVDWAFVLAPLTADRLEKGRAMLDAAEAAGVSGAMLLSVIGAGEAAKATASSPLQLPGGAAISHSTTATATGALQQYRELEKHLWNRWGASGVVLRTYFYHQNLAFWAADVRDRAGALRLPFVSGGFCPLHQADVAAVAVAVAREKLVDAWPSCFGGATFNLTGPQVLTGPALAAEASVAIGSPIVFENVLRTEAKEILEATGQLTRSEAELLLDLLELQPTMCLPSSSPPGPLICPSPDVQNITGQPGNPVRRFFAEMASSFRPSPII